MKPDPDKPPPPLSARIGVAKGRFVVPDDIDQDNEEIAKMFYGDLWEPDEKPAES